MSNKHNLSLYSVNVEPCEEGGFFASCPLLPGCHAEGETYGEAIDNITSVIEAYLAVRQKHNETVPMVSVRKSTDLNIQIPLLVRA